jgi:hypothetical protein
VGDNNGGCGGGGRDDMVTVMVSATARVLRVCWRLVAQQGAPVKEFTGPGHEWSVVFMVLWGVI